MKKEVVLIIVLCLATFYATAQLYHPEDKEGLREFLRQPAYTIGEKNGELLGLSMPRDTINWETEEEWIRNVRHLTWNQEIPKRLIKVDFSPSAYLGGRLDCNKWPALTYLSCYGNMITELDVSNCLALEYLDCNSSWLKTLDLSNNSALTLLDCRYGGDPSFSWQARWEKLTSLNVSNCVVLKEIYCEGNALTELDVSDCSALGALDCDGNLLTNLDLSANVNLEFLKCNGNQLKILDMSNNPVLKVLHCGWNQLIAIDVDSCPLLQELLCADNCLTTLNVSNNPALTYLHLAINKVTDLDIRSNTLLTFLRCDYNRLLELDASANPFLDTFLCFCNQLVYLQIHDDAICREFDCSYNSLAFSKLPKGGYHSLYAYAPQRDMTKVMLVTESLDISSEYSIERFGNTLLTNYRWYEGDTEITSGITNNNGVFTFNQALAGKRLRCEMTNGNFSDLTLCYHVILKEKAADNYFHEEDKEGLRIYLRQDNNLERVWGIPNDTLDWYVAEKWVLPLIGLDWTSESANNRLLSLSWWGGALSGEMDAGKWTALKSFTCGYNNISKLDLSNCLELSFLQIEGMPLISLNISNLKILTKIAYSESELKYLYARNCKNLETLNCSSNQLVTLDVSDCADLINLNCSSNQLTTLNMNNCTALGNLQCHNNRLTTLDVSSCPDLINLQCSNNQLTTLNINSCSALTNLYCYNNRLTTLNANNCTALKNLQCYSNQLTTLQLNACTALTDLNCSKNQLATLNTNECTALIIMRCDDNQLTNMQVSNCSNLVNLNCRNNQLLFSRLPLKIKYHYYYSPQDTIDGGNAYYLSGIDLSKEYDIDGNITQFSWFDVSGNTEQPIELAGENGMFPLTEDFIGKRLRCKMANETFPLLNGADILVYETTVSGEERIDAPKNELLHLYPNPTQGKFFIDYKDDLPVTIKCYDLFGREVKTQKTIGKTEFDISYLPTGIYLVRIINKDKIIANGKIMKQ